MIISPKIPCGEYRLFNFQIARKYTAFLYLECEIYARVSPTCPVGNFFALFFRAVFRFFRFLKSWRKMLCCLFFSLPCRAVCCSVSQRSATSVKLSTTTATQTLAVCEVKIEEPRAWLLAGWHTQQLQYQERQQQRQIEALIFVVRIYRLIRYDHEEESIYLVLLASYLLLFQPQPEETDRRPGARRAGR